MKLNIGCGQDKLDGYVNIDIREEIEPDMVMDIRYLEKIKDESCEEILASHVIEHFPIWAEANIVKLWKTKLKIGGQLIVRCPDLVSIAKMIITDDSDPLLAQHLFGKQDHPWNYHCTGFTEKTLCKLLRDRDFLIVSTKTDYPNLEVIVERHA